MLYCLAPAYSVCVSTDRIQRMMIVQEITTTTLQSFYDPFSGTTWVSRYQKDKPFWILLKQRWWGGIGISWTVCKLFALCSRQITMPAPHHSDFYGLDALPDTQPTASKHWRQKIRGKIMKAILCFITYKKLCTVICKHITNSTVLVDGLGFVSYLDLFLY